MVVLFGTRKGGTMNQWYVVACKLVSTFPELLVASGAKAQKTLKGGH